MEDQYLSSILILQRIFYHKNGNNQSSGVSHLIALFKSYKTIYIRNSEKYGHLSNF
jgi:hypothetical protein